MTQIKKFAWYGSSVAFAALLAVTLLVIGSAERAEAASTTVYDTVAAATDSSPPATLMGESAVHIASDGTTTTVVQASQPGNEQAVDVGTLGTVDSPGGMTPAVLASTTGSAELFALAALLFALAAALHVATLSPGLLASFGIGNPWRHSGQPVKEDTRRTSAGMKPSFFSH